MFVTIWLFPRSHMLHVPAILSKNHNTIHTAQTNNAQTKTVTKSLCIRMFDPRIIAPQSRVPLLYVHLVAPCTRIIADPTIVSRHYCFASRRPFRLFDWCIFAAPRSGSVSIMIGRVWIYGMRTPVFSLLRFQESRF
jgi:hypothetical protein